MGLAQLPSSWTRVFEHALCSRKRRDEAKSPSSPMTPSPGEGGKEQGLSCSLRNGAGVGQLKPKGRRQEGHLVQQKKQSTQGLAKLGLAAQSSHVGEKIKEGDWGSSCPFPEGKLLSLGPQWFWQPRWGGVSEFSLPAFAPSRATLGPLVLLVLPEKMAPKVLEETVAPPAELVTLASKVLLEPLARRESLEMMVPL